MSPKRTRRSRSLSRRFPWLVIAIAAILLVLWAILLLPRLVAFVWVPACTVCHVEETRTHADATHASIDCLECHGGASLTQQHAFRSQVLTTMVMKFSSVREQSVPDDACLVCHDQMQRNTVVAANGLNFNHAMCVGNSHCSDCHAFSGHAQRDRLARGFSMNDCLRCHQESSMAQDQGCTLCHNEQRRLRTTTGSSTFSTVHGAQWEQNHGLGDQSTCSTCHDNTSCARCHGSGVPHGSRIVSQHSSYATDPDAYCTSCHTDERFCLNCHGMEMPHPEGFLAQHSSLTVQLGQELCARCHFSRDCETCHAAHIHPGGAANPGGTVGSKP